MDQSTRLDSWLSVRYTTLSSRNRELRREVFHRNRLGGTLSEWHGTFEHHRPTQS